MVVPMARKPDWQALDALFSQPAPSPVSEPPSAAKNDMAVYNGERLPKWLVRDLMRERVAIREYDGGMTREEVQALTRQGLGAVRDDQSERARPRLPSTATPQRAAWKP